MKNSGGIPIPEVITCKTPGLKGKFFRLIGNKRGWYHFNLWKEITNHENTHAISKVKVRR